MTVLTDYHERMAPCLRDPLLLGVSLIRQASAPYVLYEERGDWSFGSGAVIEIVLTAAEIRYRHGPEWTTELVVGDPLQQVARILSEVDLVGWRAYGWIAFELSYLLHGQSASAGTEPVLHLVVPDREVRLVDGGAVLRSVHPDGLHELAVALAEPAEPIEAPACEYSIGTPEDSRYREIVAAAVSDIRSRRLQKVILSRVIPVDHDIDLIATYEAGRRANTPARSFVLDLGSLRAAGFSPETVVEVDCDGMVSTQPLAGTRALSGDPVLDRYLRAELLRDSKEIFEHAISVQTAQDELRTICMPSSVSVNEFMAVRERGSVQHLASRVSGWLTPERNAWHAMAALFPAVTVSGIPKAAACESIRQYEDRPRGLYSGAVVVIDSNGALDAALALRSIFQQDGRTWLRAGAGIVEQSDPDRELEETCEKLRSISRFLVAQEPDFPVIGRL